jgi:hypothetical protein
MKLNSNNITFYSIAIIALLLFFFSCIPPIENKISIVKFEAVNESNEIISDGEVYYYKIENYLIMNYYSSKKNDEYINKFICMNRDTLKNKYSEYMICCYKESEKTNIKNIEENPRDFVRYSQKNDLIFTFKWRNDHFLFKKKHKGKDFVPDFKCK